MKRRKLLDILFILLLLCLPLLLYAPVALGQKTLLPVDRLFLFEPYRSAAEEFGIDYPQNHLAADLILQNAPWKRLLVRSLADSSRGLTDRFPFWDPYVFSGHPFLANGQHSALYPLSIVFFILPLWRAFGVFIWLQLGLAGAFAYLFARVLGIRRLGALTAGITFQFSGFMVVSVVHPMLIAGAAWLPFILAMAELIVQQRPALGGRPASLPWALLGAAGIGCQLLAGHAENSGFVLLILAGYTAWRALLWPDEPRAGERRWLLELWHRARRPLVWIGLMTLVGLAFGAVQFIPLYEVVTTSFRGGQEAASLQQVLEWAYPWRRLVTFAVPNFFGNPTHHRYFDLFSWSWQPAPTFSDGRYIDWGVKSYVEGGAYLGLLPLLLAGLSVGRWGKRFLDRRRGRDTGEREQSGGRNWARSRSTIPYFSVLALFSLACVFGTPVYAVVYALPFFRQSHAPFRWVFPLTVAVAMLAAYGVDTIAAPSEGGKKRSRWFLFGASVSPSAGMGSLCIWGGAALLSALVAARAFFPTIAPFVEQAYRSLAKAERAFPDVGAFFSYEWLWIGVFALLLTASGIVLRVSRCRIFLLRRPVWEFLLVTVLLIDLVSFGIGFNPAVDPALLDYVPPSIEFLQQDETVWRYATYTPPGTTRTMDPNVGMLHQLQSVDGYDSLFSEQYVEYMSAIEEQDELQFNQIASFSELSSLQDPLFDLLNVKYLVSEVELPLSDYRPVYRDEAVIVYENLEAFPRAFTLPVRSTVVGGDVGEIDPSRFVMVEPGAMDDVDAPPGEIGRPGALSGATIEAYTENDVSVTATITEPSWVVLGDSHFPGWKAYIQPLDIGPEETVPEQEVPIHRVDGNFRGVIVSPDKYPGEWTVRFTYTPNSVKVGAFVSFIAGVLALFLTGLYLWRFFYREEDDASMVRRVAKNSIAPIVLNLFNRSIDFAFAMLAARILGPGGLGRYAWAINAYLWFDIVANFGLDMYLMREVSSRRKATRRLFVNTTVLRLLLYVVVVPLAAGFIFGWHTVIGALSSDVIWAVALLCLGMLPGSLANGVASLFKAWEKHEVPAAVQTLTTIVKVVLGVIALISGLGIAGLAGASIVTNLVTLSVNAVLAYRLVWREAPPAEVDVSWSLQRSMLVQSWPLMAAFLLQTLFPSINVLLLKPLQGDTAVGWYDAGRKWLDALNIVPSFFTYAVFPVMSRQAVEDLGRFRRSYRLSIKLLTLISLPVAIVVTLLARPMVTILSGMEFLPHGAIALRLLIWSSVFGWMNSLTSYVLIALKRQRYVLVAYGARVVFALVSNVLFVPSFSYVASSITLIAGEFLVVILFAVELRREVGAVQWIQTLGRPFLCALAMGATALVLLPVNRLLAVIVSAAVYALASFLLGALSPEERRMLAPLIPVGLFSRSGDG